MRAKYKNRQSLAMMVMDVINVDAEVLYIGKGWQGRMNVVESIENYSITCIIKGTEHDYPARYLFSGNRKNQKCPRLIALE